MRTATLISYSFQKEISLKEKERFRRMFLGFKDKSNYGKYEYGRTGFLGAIPHLKPAKSLIVVKHDDEKKTLSLLKKFGVKYLTWKILLNKQDCLKLNIEWAKR